MTISELKETVFVLSPFYGLPNSEDMVGFDEAIEEGMEEIERIKNKELFFLSSRKGSYFLINPIIHAFLTAFKTPKTIVDVIVDFAKQSNCKPEQIEETMISFLRKMGSRRILLTEEYAKDAQAYLDNKPVTEQWYEIGDKIGAYEIVKTLSIRGATQLYICKHPEQEAEVVVKILIFPEEFPESVRIRDKKKFSQEFLFMEELKGHPNICKLVELNTDEEFPYAAMEKIEGKSLRSFSKIPGISMETKLDIIHQILAVIAYVQGHEIIHGDLHLSNFIITAENKVRLIDFGLSNHKELQDDEIIRNGGVHECVPPERVKVKGFSTFKQRGDARSEVFQLGVLIYFILYKQYPFSGFTWSKLAESIQEEILEYSKQTADGQNIPENLLELLEISMQKKPENRFEDADEMLRFFEKKCCGNFSVLN